MRLTSLLGAVELVIAVAIVAPVILALIAFGSHRQPSARTDSPTVTIAKSRPFSEVQPDPNFPHLRTIRTKIRGVTKQNRDGLLRQDIIRQGCHVGDALWLVRESDNPVDPNAIRIFRMISEADAAGLGEQLGYVSRELAEDLAPRMAAGSIMFARISDLTGDITGQDGRSVGVNIQIEEYVPAAQLSHTNAS